MKIRDLEINLLRAFLAVAENGSFTAGAIAVGRSQSAVSQKIIRLEQIIGQAVFERTSRSLALTVAGERLLATARTIVEANDRLIRSLEEPKTSGLLRIGIAEDFIPGQLHRLLGRFARLYPGVEISLVTGLSPSLLAMFDGGQLDAVIAKRDFDSQDGRVIWQEPLLWMAAAGFPASGEEAAPLVMLPKPSVYRNLMVEKLAEIGRDWTVACTVGSLWSVQAAIAGGLGIAVLGSSFLRDDMQVLKDPERWPPLPPLEIVLLGERTHASHLVEALVAFLSESLPLQMTGSIAKPVLPYP